MESIINGLVQIGSDKSNIILSYVLPKPPDQYKALWIRIVQDSFIDIRKITQYLPSEKKVTLDKELRFAPTTLSKYDIGDYNIPSTKAIPIKVSKNSTKDRIKLEENVKKMDKIYDNYWIQITSGKSIHDVRQVKEYIDNSFVLDYPLSNDINEGDNLLLLPHIFNDYILFGTIDFTDFLGMDFSSLIDSLGGLFNFQMTTSVSSLCCLVIISVLVVLVIKNKKKKLPSQNTGLFIPGIGRLSPQQPLVIQMPMQTKPFELPNSPFPKLN